jgi:hypothetical protein
MPPSDDDYRAEALGAMIALVAQLDRAPHRTAALATARNIRALLARADQVLKQPGETDELHSMANAARDRIVKSMGTSAWDEPEVPRHSPLPAAPGTESPLTDRQLAIMEADANAVSMVAPGVVVGRLIREVRRLRSDEWLQRAVDDIGALDTLEGHVDMAKALAILRKHRDGTKLSAESRLDDH